MTNSQRADALVDAGHHNFRHNSNSSDAAGFAALTQLWQFYTQPELLERDCQRQQAKALIVPMVLGSLCRIMLFVLVRWKVARKAQE